MESQGNIPEHEPRKNARPSICLCLFLHSTKVTFFYHCVVIGQLLKFCPCWLCLAYVWQQGRVGQLVSMACPERQHVRCLTGRMSIPHTSTITTSPSPLHSAYASTHSSSWLCQTVMPFASMPQVSTLSMLTCMFNFSSPKRACVSIMSASEDS